MSNGYTGNIPIGSADLDGVGMLTLATLCTWPAVTGVFPCRPGWVAVERKDHGYFARVCAVHRLCGRGSVDRFGRRLDRGRTRGGGAARPRLADTGKKPEVS